MPSTTQQHSRIVAFTAFVLIAIILWIYPVADLQDPRFSAFFRFATGTAILLAVIMWSINKWVSLFVVLALFSSIIPFSTKESTEAWQAVFIGCLWFYIVSKYVQTENHVNVILNSICILAILNSIYLIFQYYSLDPIFTPKFGKASAVTGFLSNKNEVSAYLAFSVFAFFRPKWKWFVPLILLGLMIAHSMGGIISASIGIIAYFFFKDKVNALKKNFFKILFVLCLLILFLSYVDPIPGVYVKNPSLIPKQYDRILVWKQAIDLFPQHWIFGSGIGHWKIVFKKIPIKKIYYFSHAHNEFVQGLFEMGFLFSVIILGYFINLIRKYNRNAIIPASAIVAICFNSMVNFPLHIAQTSILILTWMALFEVQTKWAAEH